MDNQEGPRKKARRSSLTASIGDLLSSGKYSDLEIRCDGKSFKVHRNIVCGRSNVMDKECDGGFLEAHSRVIKHSVFDSSAVDRMLQFMYRSDYQLELACPTAQHLDTATEDTVTVRSPDPATGSDEPAVGTSIEAGCNDELVAHVYVYAIADYYELPALQDLAVMKFKSARDRREAIAAENLVELAAVVYTNTTDEATDMRDQLFSLVWRNPWSSFDSELFMHALATRTELQEFAADIVEKTTVRHRSCEHALQAQAKKLQDSVNAHEAALAAASNKIKALEKELSLRRRDVQDLTEFAEIDACSHCQSMGGADRPFTYSVSARSRDRGYAANCLICGRRYTRT